MKIKYRLGLDLGANSLGWCVYRLGSQNEPEAIVRAGVRIFSDGRDPKSLASRAADRRLARQVRRRRDRMLKRRARIMEGLVRFGLMPADVAARKALQLEEPFALRATGLDKALTPHQLGRALFHLCRKRGFKSSRKDSAEKGDSEVKWADVIGMETAKRDAWEIVQFIKDTNKVKAMGGTMISRMMAFSSAPAARNWRRVTTVEPKRSISARVRPSSL